MARVGGALRIVRIPALVGLLLLVNPVFDGFVTAVQRMDMEPLRWKWTALVVIAVVFLAVALVARQPRQPPWLLGVEVGIAGLIGLVVPAWSVWLTMRPDGLELPSVVEPLVEVLSSGSPFSGGMGLAMNWFVLILTLAWLVVVVESALRQVRLKRALRRRQEQPVD